MYIKLYLQSRIDSPGVCIYLYYAIIYVRHQFAYRRCLHYIVMGNMEIVYITNYWQIEAGYYGWTNIGLCTYLTTLYTIKKKMNSWSGFIFNDILVYIDMSNQWTYKTNHQLHRGTFLEATFCVYEKFACLLAYLIISIAAKFSSRFL